MLYMTPSRRAMAKRRPRGSARNSRLKTWWEATCSLWPLTATPQSPGPALLVLAGAADRAVPGDAPAGGGRIGGQHEVPEPDHARLGGRALPEWFGRDGGDRP